MNFEKIKYHSLNQSIVTVKSALENWKDLSINWFEKIWDWNLELTGVTNWSTKKINKNQKYFIKISWKDKNWNDLTSILSSNNLMNKIDRKFGKECNEIFNVFVTNEFASEFLSFFIKELNKIDLTKYWYFKDNISDFQEIESSEIFESTSDKIDRTNLTRNLRIIHIEI